jgi:hypothetical protein
MVASALGIAIIAMLLIAQQQARSNRVLAQLRRENDALREQLRQTPALGQPVRPAVDPGELERLHQDERELLRLRGEVSRLRQETQDASTQSTEGTVLKRWCRLNTTRKYQPPVEITIIAKTDSTNLRLAYAADQVIFNWELDEWQLRVDGGPANGHHKPGAGHIPPNQYVTIRWVVTPGRQAIYVDGDLRFEHEGDYSNINRCVTVFPEVGSIVTVKSIAVTRLAGPAQTESPDPFGR